MLRFSGLPSANQWPRYVWALPVSLIGLAFAGCAGRIGARLNFRDGVLEVDGPGSRRLLDALAPRGRVVLAMTLGHVVLARNADALARTRLHEAPHVRQYERWGPLLLPAYIFSGVLAGWHGGDSYRDNIFERGLPNPK